MKATLLPVFLFVALVSFPLRAQEAGRYSFRQSLSAFGEYSNNSSHIFLGVSENRRLIGFGVAYSRRLVHTSHFDWYYAPELLPLFFIQDPIATFTLTTPSSMTSFSAPSAGACVRASFSSPVGPAPGILDYTLVRTCSTRWTYAGGLSPLGQRINFGPRHRIQPFVVGNAGFLVSSRDVPVDDSSSFNFTFEFGAGVEFFRDSGHSWSAEYRLHHLSNAYTGNLNPGIDNPVIKVTYTIGR